MSDVTPRWLPAPEAARHVGMDTEGFRRAVRRGILPRASYKLGPQSPRWDRHALDQAMGAQAASDGIGEAVNGLVAKMRAEHEAKAQNRTKAAR